MDLFQTRYFVEVADKLSFRLAADNLHVSSSSLSVQIRKLEEEIGAELLVRGGGYLKLTEAGSVFLKEARQVLAQASHSLVLARQAAHHQLTLSIGYNAVAEASALPRMVPAFKQQCPHARLTFRRLRTTAQLAQLASGQLDLGFICSPTSTQYDVLELYREPFVAVVPTHHPLASAPTVSFEALSGEPLILYSRVLDPDFFSQINERFARANAVLNIVYELESAQALIHFVAAGTGCTIVPAYAPRYHGHNIACRPLEPPAIMRTLTLTQRRESCSTLANTFFQVAAELFRSDMPSENEESLRYSAG